MDWSTVYLITGVVAAVVSTAVGLLVLTHELRDWREKRNEAKGHGKLGTGLLMVQGSLESDSSLDGGSLGKASSEEVSSGKESSQNG